MPTTLDCRDAIIQPLQVQTVLCKVRDMENAVRAVLRESGLKVGAPGRKLFATRVRELAETDPSLADITEPLLAIIAAMHCQLERLTRRVLEAVRVEPICRQLMTVPGVGPLTSPFARPWIDLNASDDLAMSAPIWA